MTIFKYILEVDNENILQLPQPHKILTIQVQNEKLVLWAEVNPSGYKRDVKIIMLGTGQAFHDNQNKAYISTIQLLEGHFVGHLFEVL